MDITDALAPTSDQLDAIELVNPRTFTIDTGSALGTRDGKTVAEIRLAEFSRVWRPSKGMLDVLAACWGTDAKQWVGHRVTLYNDPEVMFGRDKVGGVRISHLSHIDKARTVSIRGSGAARKKAWPVQPLPDVQAPAKLADNSQPVTPETLALLLAALEAADIPEAAWVSGAKRITGATVTRLEQLAEDDARSIIVELEARAGGAS